MLTRKNLSGFILLCTLLLSSLPGTGKLVLAAEWSEDGAAQYGISGQALEEFGEELAGLKAYDEGQEYIPVEEQTASEQEQCEFQTGRLIVKSDRPIFDASATAVAGPYHSIYVLQYEDSGAAEEAYRYYGSCSWVSFVQADQVHSGLSTSSALRTAAAKNSGVSICGFANMQKRIADYYGGESKVPEVTVAVLDTGIEYDHKALKDRVTDNGYNAVSYGFMGGFFSSLLPSFNLPEDDNGHGTEVAGVIAMSTPDYVRILPVKVADSWGYMDDSEIYLGVEYAISQKVDVINMSFGGEDIVKLTKEYLDDCYKAGVVVVSAYGNEHVKTSSVYPACYDNVIGVSAVNNDLSFAKSYSNYGSKVDLTAPGTNVYTTCPEFVDESGYTKVTGTSFSTPYVAAGAALVKALYPKATVTSITGYLTQNAKDLGEAGWDSQYGYGLLYFPETANSTMMAETVGTSDAAGEASGRSTGGAGSNAGGSSSDTDSPAASSLSKPVLTALSTKKTGLKLTWKKVSGADGYDLYRKPKGGSWTKLKTVTGGNKVSYTDTKAKSGGNYYYRIRAYRGSTKSSYSASLHRVWLAPTKLTKAGKGKRRATIVYQKVSGASGYQIQYSTKKDFSSNAKKVTVGSIRQKTITGLTGRKTYYFRVRAYRTVGGVRYYSTWSTNVKKVKIS